MERRVAERIAAKASGRSSVPPWKQNGATASSSRSHDSEERAPDSGVRESQPKLGLVGPNDGRGLSFTVYSVEELDARQRLSAPLVSRESTPPPPPSRWPDAWRSFKHLSVAWVGWYKTPKPRSRMMDVCGVPLAALKADVLAGLKQLPWRKILVRGGIGFGAFLFLMFVVLTAAELTDDMKPGAPRQTSTMKMAAPAMSEAPKKAEDATPPPQAQTIELEEPAVTPPPKKAVTPTKKPTATKKGSGKKKGPDVFNP